jgi:hypothetical protein
MNSELPHWDWQELREAGRAATPSDQLPFADAMWEMSLAMLGFTPDDID